MLLLLFRRLLVSAGVAWSFEVRILLLLGRVAGSSCEVRCFVGRGGGTSLASVFVSDVDFGISCDTPSSLAQSTR